MKAVKIVVLAVAVAMAGGGAVARPFDRRKGIDFIKLAEKAAEAKLRQQAAQRSVVRRHARHVPPHGPATAPYRSARRHGRDSGRCSTVLRKVWIPGHYEQVVQHVPVRGWRGRHGGPRCGRPATRPIVVKRWVAGHYEWQHVPVHHVSCRRTACNAGSHRGGAGHWNHR